jgi:hypothetical protein
MLPAMSPNHPVGTQCMVHALGEVDLVGGWVEVALDASCAARIGADYQVLVTSYSGIALFVQNRTPAGFEIHAVPDVRARPRRPTRCSYCVLAWASASSTVARDADPSTTPRGDQR